MHDDTEPMRRDSFYLESGHIRFSVRPVTIQTVVGSCVAVCLWDAGLKFGGMNHFMHPIVRDPRCATARYGNVATVALVRMMEDAGSKCEDIVAQILGGAVSAKGEDDSIGAENIGIARKVLARKGIQIMSEDVGGKLGRKVAFNTGTGELAVLKVHRIRQADWH